MRKSKTSQPSWLRRAWPVMLLAILLSGPACTAQQVPAEDLWNGKRLFQRGDYEKALAAFKKAGEQDPETQELVQHYIRKTLRAMRGGDTTRQKAFTKGKRAESFTCPDREINRPNSTPQPKVSGAFVMAELRETLLELSLQSGVSIVPDQTVEGLVSASFEKVTLEAALRILLAPGSYSFRRLDGFYLVGEGTPDNPSFHLLSTTCWYKPAHLRPKEILQLLAPFYRRFVSYHEARGILTVSAPRSVMDRIERDIISFDRQSPQVLLELTIVEVNRVGREFLGIDWAAGKRGTGADDILGKSLALTGGGGPLGLTYKLTNVVTSEFQASINWLRKKGNAVLKSTPSIVSLDGHLAVFTSLHNSWVRTGAGGDEHGEKSKPIQYGVELKIVPHIAQSRQVVLNILLARVSDLTTNHLGMPEVVSHSISTTVRVREGEALVLGGLLQKKRRLNTTKVPILADIPLLGAFFRSEQNEVEEMEILIVIQPKILSKMPVISRKR